MNCRINTEQFAITCDYTGKKSVHTNEYQFLNFDIQLRFDYKEHLHSKTAPSLMSMYEYNREISEQCVKLNIILFDIC